MNGWTCGNLIASARDLAMFFHELLGKKSILKPEDFWSEEKRKNKHRRANLLRRQRSLPPVSQSSFIENFDDPYEKSIEDIFQNAMDVDNFDEDLNIGL